MVDEFEEVSKKLCDFLRHLAPDQGHKYVVLEEIEKAIFGDPGGVFTKALPALYMSDDQIEFLMFGSEAPSFEDLKEAMKTEEDEVIVGLMNLCELNLGYFNFRKTKRSSEMALKMIWRMLSDPDYKLRSVV